MAIIYRSLEQRQRSLASSVAQAGSVQMETPKKKRGMAFDPEGTCGAAPQLKVIGPHLHHEHWSDHHTCTTQGAKCNLSILFCFSLNFQKLLLTVSHAVGREEGSRHPHHGGGSSHLLGSPNLASHYASDDVHSRKLVIKTLAI